MPKSTNQISPDLSSDRHCLKRIKHLEVGVRAAITIGERLRFLFQFDEPAHDLPAVGMRQAGQFDKD